MVMKCPLVADHPEQEKHQKNVYLSDLTIWFIKTHFIENNQYVTAENIIQNIPPN